MKTWCFWSSPKLVLADRNVPKRQFKPLLYSISALLLLCLSIRASHIGLATDLVHPRTQIAAGQCDANTGTESLAQYAKKCLAVIGEDVPSFNCDEGTLVPEDNLNVHRYPPGTANVYPNQDCDRPNVLNHECDPGSRFQVLKQTSDVTIVGHCRKKGNSQGRYGDIAVYSTTSATEAPVFTKLLRIFLPQLAICLRKLQHHPPGMDKVSSLG